MDEFEASLASASDALSALVDGPGLTAARALEDAFANAGTAIETALSRAARTGEADFARMAQSVLADLARITAEAALARAGIGEASQAVTFNITGAASGSTQIGLQQELSKAFAKAAVIGGRFL